MRKPVYIIITLLLIFCLAGCSAEEGMPPMPEVSEIPAPSESCTLAEGTEKNASVSVLVPEGWEFEAVELAQGGGTFGIKLYPAEDKSGSVSVLCYYEQPFAVCGTGLTLLETKLGDRPVRMGYYNGGTNWQYIEFTDAPGCYVVLREAEDGWMDKYGAELLSILSTVKVGEGHMTLTEAFELAQYMPNITYDSYYGRFDYESDTWVLTFSSSTEALAQEFCVLPDGTVRGFVIN